MKSQLLTLEGTTIRRAESQLRRYMVGLDTRLTPVSSNQAILAGPHARALSHAYSRAGAARILNEAGVAKATPLSDVEVVGALRARDLRELPPRIAYAQRAGLDPNWHLDNIRALEAWESIPSAPSAIDWADVRIGHIDTGYSRHPAFGFETAPWIDIAAAETYFAPEDDEGPVDPPPEPGHGVDPLVGGHNPGHGTKSGSTVVGRSSVDDYYGVAPGCPVVPVRICDTVWISDRQPEFVLGIDHVLASDVGVITVCLGIWPLGPVKAVRQAVERAYQRGVIMVCAAGQYVSAVVSPAKLPQAIAVAGTTFEDVPWAHSCHGPEVALSAPAADITSASSTLKAGNPSYAYAGGSDGTTYATAMVSGAAALWLLAHRDDLPNAYPQPWQRVEAFRQCVRQSARTPDGWPAGFGAGILDVRALLDEPLPPAAELSPAS